MENPREGGPGRSRPVARVVWDWEGAGGGAGGHAEQAGPEPEGAVRCPWCGSEDVERVGEFGPQLLTHAYLCVRCRSPFEVIRR